MQSIDGHELVDMERVQDVRLYGAEAHWSQRCGLPAWCVCETDPRRNRDVNLKPFWVIPIEIRFFDPRSTTVSGNNSWLPQARATSTRIANASSRQRRAMSVVYW